MAVSKERQAQMLKYAKDKLKRIPLDVTKEKFEIIKAHADAAGQSVNGYIKDAIDARIDNDDKKNEGKGD